MKKEERIEWIERFISEQTDDPEVADIWRSKLRMKYKIKEEYEPCKKYRDLLSGGLRISWQLFDLSYKKQKWYAETKIEPIVLHSSEANNQWIYPQDSGFFNSNPMNAGKKDHLCKLYTHYTEPKNHNDYFRIDHFYKSSAMGQINDLFVEALKICYDGLHDYNKEYSYIFVEYISGVPYNVADLREDLQSFDIQENSSRPIFLEQFGTASATHGKYLKPFMDKHGSGCDIILNLIKNKSIADYIDPDSNLHILVVLGRHS